jgi:hypothetical protein
MRKLSLQFMRSEDGAATVYAMFVFALAAMLGGLAIDSVNASRGRAQLAVIADIASHAGVVALAQDASLRVVQNAVSDIVKRNGAEALLHDPLAPNGGPEVGNAVQILHYDAESNRVQAITSSGSLPNAIAVMVRYDEANGNALPTIFLHMLGIASWDLGHDAVTALMKPSNCSAGDTVLSRDLLSGFGRITVGQGFCLHAQHLMEFSLPPILEPGAWFSLPDLDACRGICAELLTKPEGQTAASELNILQPEFNQHIGNLAQAFSDPLSSSPDRMAFFKSRPVSLDLSSLAEVGVDIGNLATGAVVDLEPIQIDRARQLPQGLVYRVSCAKEPEDKFIFLGGPGPKLEGSALVTDCPVVVARAGDLSSALVISTWPGVSGLNLPAVEIMAVENYTGCRRTRSVLMAQEAVYLLSGASGTGLGLVSATEIQLFAPSGGGQRTQHYGLAVHAGKKVYLGGEHLFEACGVPDEEGLLPPMHIVRQVTPVNMASVYPPKLRTSEGARHLTVENQ